MNKLENIKLAVSFRRDWDPAELPAYARGAEAAGVDQLYLVEDCFYASGIAAASAALAATRRIPVGIGILPAVARNPVFTAMEIATLAKLFPGRLTVGVGHGVNRWMKQIGALPTSQMAALEECVIICKRLLAGERVDFSGKQFRLDDGKLVHPPQQPPPIYLGVRGPRSLALSGRVADGTILAEFSSPAYVRWAVEHIHSGNTRRNDHHITAFIYACASASVEEGIKQVKPLVANAIASCRKDMYFQPLGVMPEVEALRAIPDPVEMAKKIPDEWVRQMALLGTPADWQVTIAEFAAAGVDTLVLVPLRGTGTEQLQIFAGQLNS